MRKTMRNTGQIGYIALFVFLIYSCNFYRPHLKDKGFGGKWNQQDSLNLVSYKIGNTATPTAFSGSGEFNLAGDGHLQVPKFTQNKGSLLSVVEASIPDRVQRKLIDSVYSSNPSQRKEAKNTLFVTMGSAMVYAVGYVLLGQPAFGLLMWLPAISNPLLLMLGVILVLALLYVLLTSTQVLKDMKKNRNSDGKQFAIIALLGSLGMLVSMAPLVAVTIVLVLYWLIML